MTKSKHVIALAALSVVSGAALTAQAASFTWTAGPGNGVLWSTGFGGTYPNTAGDTATIPPLNGNLTINLDVANSVLGTLTFGSTGFSTDIGNNNATGNALTINPGATGSGSIVTTGTGLNTISAPLTLLSNVELASSSTTGLTLNGLTVDGNATNGTVIRQLNNNAAGTLTLNGTINVTEAVPVAPALTTSIRGLLINGSGTPTVNNGNVVINGTFSTNGRAASAGTVQIGGTSTATGFTRSTVTIVGDQSTFGGNITLARANVIATNDTAFGTGRLLFGGATNAIGAFLTTNAPRTIPNAQVQVQQFFNITGSQPITFNGRLVQSASRGVASSSTATITYNNGLYAANSATDARVFIIDGSGNTVVNNGLHNGYDLSNNVEFPNAVGTYDKRGTGTALINGSSNYTGATRVRGGLLQFADATGLGTVLNANATVGTTGITIDAGGAIGIATGSLDPTFLGKIQTGGGESYRLPATPTVNGTDFRSRGAIALAPSDAAVNINYGAGGNLAGSNLQTTGIGAIASGVTFTGTITPAASTYRLGGGGTLTLPNANQLTGANAVVADNGGAVAVTGSNNYTGTTTIGGAYINPSGELDRLGQTINLFTNPATTRVNSTVSVSSLANGGTASGLGSSSNAASNLVLSGGTLQYTGSGASTDRLFTVGANGATLDASGTGAVNFTNTGAIVQRDAAAARTANIDINGSRTLIYVDDPTDIVPGQTVTGTGIPTASTTVLAVFPPSFGNIGGTGAVGQYQVLLNGTSSTATTAAIPDLAFGNQNRTLTLTGTSTAVNAVSGALTNSATGTLGISKTGAGTWALAGNNTYTGSTTVTAGTLQVNNATALPSGSAVTVGGGAGAATVKLGGGFTQNLSSLTFASGGRFDVGTGILFNNNGGGAAALAAAKALVTSGYNGGASNGPGYISSSADAKHGVGYIDTGTGIEIRYTLYGDADLDGGVSINDFNKLAGNFGQASGRFWIDGDFDYDGGVSINDFNLLAGNFGQTLPANSPQWAGLLAFAVAHNDLEAFQAVTGVPEPTTLGLIAAGGALALRRRRRA